MCYDKYKSKNINSLVVELTRDCNFKCNHCLRGEEEKNKVFDKKLFRKFLIDNNIRNIDNITLSGGEPTLNLQAMKDILELLKHYQIELGSFFIATNGSKLNFEFIKILSDYYTYCSIEKREMSYVKISNSPWHKEERAKRNIKLEKLERFTNLEELNQYVNDNIFDYYVKDYIDEIAEKVVEEQKYISDEDDELYNENDDIFKENIKKELLKNNYPYESYDIRKDILSEDYSLSFKNKNIYTMLSELNLNNKSLFELENSDYMTLINNGRVKNNSIEDFKIEKRKKREENSSELEETFNLYKNDNDLLNLEEYTIDDIIYFSYNGKVTGNCNFDFNQIDKMSIEPKEFFEKGLNNIINKLNKPVKKLNKNKSIELEI